MPQLEATEKRLDTIHKQMKGNITRGVLKAGPAVKNDVVALSTQVLQHNIQHKMKQLGIN